MSIEFDELDKARESADDKQGLFQSTISHNNVCVRWNVLLINLKYRNTTYKAPVLYVRVPYRWSAPVNISGYISWSNSC